MRDQRVLQLLRAACRDAGSQRQWALANGIAPQAVSLVLTGRRRPSPQILDALRLERTTTTATTYRHKAAADAE